MSYNDCDNCGCSYSMCVCDYEEDYDIDDYDDEVVRDFKVYEDIQD